MGEESFPLHPMDRGDYETIANETPKVSKPKCHEVVYSWYTLIALLLLTAVEAFLVGHSLLWITYYILFTDIPCEQNETSSADSECHEYKLEAITNGSFAHIFLCVWVSFTSILDSLEYVLLGYGLMVGLNIQPKIYCLRSCAKIKCSRSSAKIKCSRSCCKMKCSSSCASFRIYMVVGSSILLSLGGTKLYLALSMEKAQENNLSPIYYTYCRLETFHILLAIAVRVYMIETLLAVKYIWETTNETQGTDPPRNNPDEKKAKKEACADFNKELIEYHRRGKEAQQHLYPFTVWFLTPWIIFMVYTSINPHFLLSPWTDPNSNILDLTRGYHLVHIVMKTFELLLQYAFAAKVNQYHRDYYLKMKLRVVLKNNSEKSPAYTAEVSQLMATIEFHDDYNFFPTFLSINPRIAADGPFYFILLLLGVFVHTSDKLFHVTDNSE